ncbi:RebB family R body protein [Vibrio bivalvicida]|uniref:Uncharacterized protein n=1 Tax=Vibrio bivalvicida TaxID=1276888 RepID=A0A177XXA1_9VIBR|nr:RebB family R body protein [Vibrio bivalvicida]OAJ93211.1 hypothetical protein APB76_14695 [Vibrio bivalvicida]
MDDKTSAHSAVDRVQDGNYSLDMVDTIFADTLSRGMQNAIISQQNAQMASSSSVTNACARILQAQAKSEAITDLPKRYRAIEQQVDDSPPLKEETESRQSPHRTLCFNKIWWAILSVMCLLIAVAGVAWFNVAGL